MADIVSRDKRSQMMARIKGTDTQPEILIRKALHRRGFRYRLHVQDMPGKPDIVLRRYRAVIMVNGCFWHGHSCHLYRIPSTRSEFWLAKINSNKKRDAAVHEKLTDAGWRILTVWECAIKGKEKLGFDRLILKIEDWILSRADHKDIRGEEC